MKKTTLALVLALLCCQLAFSQDKYSTVKIYPPNDESKRAELVGLLQLDHYYFEQDGGFIAEINQGDIKRLKGTGYRYEILVDDVAKHVNELNRQYYRKVASGLTSSGRVAYEQSGSILDSMIKKPAAFVVQGTFGGYYSFAQMNTAMTALATAYPTIVQKTSLGLSIEGRDIWCIKISDNVATPQDATEPDVLYVGLQHAREAITGASMIFFMQYLCEEYAAGNQKIIDLVDNREFYIIPCMNPDGWEYNRLNGGVGTGQRKNRRNVGVDDPPAGDQKGVDLNRNWGIDWGNCSAPILGPPSSCGSTNTSDATYWGTGAFSEPETQAIRNLVITKNFVVAFDQHAFGPYYSLPFGRRSLHTMTTPQQQFYTCIPALMGQYNGMRANDSYGALGYEVAGGFKDWMLLGDIGTGTKGTVYGMTGEGGAGGGTGGTNGSFWAPAGEIINLCQGMCYQNLQLAYSAGSYVDLQDASDIAVSSLSGNLSFSIKRIGLANAPVTVTLVPLQNISSVGAPVTVNTLTNYYDVYNGSISYTLPAAMTNGQRIKFVWRVQTGGYTYTDTIVKFYNPVQLLTDDFESGFGQWSTTFTGAGASGWGVTTAGTGYNGAGRAMSESPAAATNYTTSTTRRAHYINTMDLGNATATYLSFWVRHRAENFRDRLRVEYSTNSTDGLNGTWVVVAGTTTVQEPGTLDGATINGQHSLTGIRENWTHELFDLSAANGSAAVRIRFVFVSDTDPTSFADERDDGFYIDNLKIIKSTVALITLPVHFISFTGTLTPDKTIRLDWDAATDEQHDYFEIEKSTNGTSFSSIGKGPSSAPYWKIDANPSFGNNYYRVKQVDRDGTVTYSNIVKINYDPSSFVMSVYPNPAKEDVTLRFNTEQPERVTIRVTDLSGKTVYSKQMTVGGSIKETKISVGDWPSQTYIIKVSKSDNTSLSVQKIVKQ
ncbi:MAG: M14 family zinc carboxypeptidase [Chitinophagales bacterium]